MEMKISKEDTKRFIEYYYQKNENRDVKVKIKCEKCQIGYGLSEHEGCYTTITIEEEVDVLGSKIKTTEKVSDKNLLAIFQTILEEKGYEVKKADLDSGLDSTWEGYGINEYQVKRPYCNGVILEVDKKVKQKVIGRKEG